MSPRLRDLGIFGAELAAAFGLAVLVFELLGTSWPVLVGVFAVAVLVGLVLGAVDAHVRRPR